MMDEKTLGHRLLARLPSKQQQFLLALLADPKRNQTKAYEKVYKARGDSAANNAARLLGNDQVRAAYDLLNVQQIANAIEANDLTAARTLEEVRRLAFVNVTDCFDDVGNLKPFSQWSAEAKAALAGFEVIIKNAKAGDGETDTVHKIRMAGKLRALEMLMKHFILLGDAKRDSDGNWDKLAARLASARQRSDDELPT